MNIKSCLFCNIVINYYIDMGKGEVCVYLCVMIMRTKMAIDIFFVSKVTCTYKMSNNIITLPNSIKKTFSNSRYFRRCLKKKRTFKLSANLDLS